MAVSAQRHNGADEGPTELMEALVTLHHHHPALNYQEKKTAISI
jgi:hypothetical protein